MRRWYFNAQPYPSLALNRSADYRQIWTYSEAPMAKSRSRNYPAISLPAAIERARQLYGQEGRARAAASVVVTAWGYNSLNGASLRVLSALRQYGLLEGGNDDSKLSERALTLLLEPKGSADYGRALRDAFDGPALFQELMQEYQNEIPSDAAINSYLVRKQNFTEDAAKTLIAAFRESLELVRSGGAEYTGALSGSDAEINRDNGIEHKRSNTNALSLKKAPFELSFAWPISENTSLKMTVSGELPSDDDVTLLSQVLDLAKQQIIRAVATKRKADADMEVVVEPEEVE